jgi:hypothetical protein
MGQNGGTGGRDNSLDQYGSSGDSTTGYGSAGTVSGAYEGGGSGDALTGQSGLSQTPTKPSELICLGPGHAQRTGAGVGPLGENLGSGGQGAGRAGVGGALGGAAAGEYASLGDQAGVTRGPGAQRTVAGDGEVAGQSREPLGGTTGGLVGGLGGTSGNYSSGQNYSSTNAGLGAGAAAGGAGHGSSGGNDRGDNNNSGADSGGRTGHYGKVSDDSNRGGEHDLSTPQVSA